jgi:DNA-binding NarL/FixJ family response regulator
MDAPFTEVAPALTGRPSQLVTVARPALRVCVVDSKEIGPAYERLDECDLEVVAALPSIDETNRQLIRECEVVLVGCTEKMLLSPSFQGRALEAAQSARVVAVVPQPGPELAAYAARAGFHGFVAREVAPQALQRTVEAAVRGEMAFPRSAVASLARLLWRFGSSRHAADLHAALTPRQRQVVELIAQGATDREIANVLKISESTAHKHVQNALRRAHARTRSELVGRLNLRRMPRFARPTS